MTHEDQLAELLERWEETLSTGRTVTPEDLCHECPDLLNDFRGLLARLGAVNAVLAGHGATSPEELTARVEAGRYRPLSFHAQGGLGIVFVAEDEELRRNVALKCMQELAATDPDAQARFLREAEITSKLEHPGVVPVYGLGRDAHGKPYYAMRFVHGTTLAEAIEGYHQNLPRLTNGERHVELQRLLRRFVSVCETVAYAHARGIVHRDLKPSNILLGTYGETLVVDWGLAKRLDRPTAEPSAPALMPLLLPNDGTRTMEGEVRGSPTYMSPEQARGEWDKVGTASDVYSLGSTLYVLLTGKKPYTGRNPHDVLEKVKRGDYSPLRSVNPHVPHPLAAICQRAMHVDPGARYGGPTELARDLERWLADEPVLAWSEPLPLRARRWLRHHQTLATSAVAVVVVAAVALGVAGYSLQQKNTDLANANVREKNARQEAEANLRRNLAMLKDLLRALVSQGADAIRDNPTALALLDELTAQMDRLADDAPQKVEVARVKTVIHYLRAAVDPDPKLPPSVRQHLDAAIAGYEKWRTEAPDDLDAVEGLATTRSELGRRFYHSGDLDEARAEYQTAYDLLAAPIRDGKKVDLVYALSLANACLGIAQVSGKGGKPPLADLRPMVEETLPQLQKFRDDPKTKEPMMLAILVGRLSMLQGTILAQQQQMPEAIAVCEEGLRAVKANPAWWSIALVQTKISLLRTLAGLENERGQSETACKLYEEAIKLSNGLPRQAPGKLPESEDAGLDPFEFARIVIKYSRSLDKSRPATRDEVRRVTGLALDALDRVSPDTERPKGLDNSQDYVRHARSELESIRSAAGVH